MSLIVRQIAVRCRRSATICVSKAQLTNQGVDVSLELASISIAGGVIELEIEAVGGTGVTRVRVC